MKELKIRKRTTNIQEDTRRTLDITRDEYAFCGYVQYRQAYPEQKKRGFCCDGKDELAYFVGISRTGLYKMIDRLSLSGLLDIEATTGYLSVTKKWIDADSDCKQSRQPQKNSVNLVDTDCKLSLQDSVNLVTGNIEVQLEDKLEQEENSAAEKTAASLPENPSLEANPLKKEKPPVAQPPLEIPKRDNNDPRPHLKAKREQLLSELNAATDPTKRDKIIANGTAIKSEIELENKIDLVVDRLNAAGKFPRGYTKEKKETRTAIRKRLKEYSLDDLFAVVDSKCAEWKDTQFRKNLNPETLFNGHFEKYLNAALLDKQSPLTPNQPQPYRLEPVPERTPVPAYTP